MGDSQCHEEALPTCDTEVHKCVECIPLDDSTCPGDDNYCEISAKCVSYNYHDESGCIGDYLGILENTLEAAISRCNEDSQCGCFHPDGHYYLFKGTGISDYGRQAWVKT